MSDLKIGQVASRAGIGVDTVRYYERLGLLPTAARRASGYRVFDESTVERIKLIKRLQDLGLTLQEIDAMVRGIGDGADCAHESDKIRSALARAEDRLAALVQVRDRLQLALSCCTSGQCTIVEQVAQVTPKR
jgi:DNA-binding transcriptional MerR regulator